MPLIISPFLRKILLTDAIVSGAAGLLMIVGAGFLGPLLGLPIKLLFWAGVVLVPFVTALFLVARRESAPRLLLLDIIFLNGAWVIASFAILAAGPVSPNLLGVLFIAAQALMVGLFTVLQLAGLRSAAVAT